MHTIPITDLYEPQTVPCAVRVLGDPSTNDPAITERICTLDYLDVVSPNGKWVALCRKGSRTDHDVLTVLKAEEGAAEIVVPLKSEWCSPRIRDISDEGVLLYQAELDYRDMIMSRRSILFVPSSTTSVILPPLYRPRDIFAPEARERSAGYMPVCYTHDGKVFGWTHKRRQENDRSDHPPHCLWQRDAKGKWSFAYLPEYLDNKWVWPSRAGTFICADRPEGDDGTIRFSIFDGVSAVEPLQELELQGSDPKTIAAAIDGTFLGYYHVRDGRWGRDEKGKPHYSFCSYLIRPQRGEMRVFKEFRRKRANPQLHQLSSNAEYIIGKEENAGYFAMKAKGDGYRYAMLKANGWRIENLAGVINDGTIYATATCTARTHGCFRLKLPVALTPQW